MDTILRGVPHVICYLDDLLITGVDEEDHLHNLEQVLKLFTEHGLRLKKEKCIFLAKSVEYLGHQISKASDQQRGNQLFQVKLMLSQQVQTATQRDPTQP